MGVILDGKALAKTIRDGIGQEVARRLGQGWRSPHLAVVLASDDPASAVYVRSKGKAAEEAGIRTTQITLSAESSRTELLDRVSSLNEDDDIDGILVQLPLPKQHNVDEIIAAIDPRKDVDGLHYQNAGHLARADEQCLIPCTPRGCIRLIEHAGVSIEGARAVVLGRSRLVGRPVADLLINRSATVTICHSRTHNVAAYVAEADILIAAAGKPEFVLGSWIKPGATVIDVGIHRRQDGTLTGDVHFAPAKERARAITPVPGGVGPMTIACLLENTLIAAERRRGTP
jgi:methylenetetrahydrofolate dehydrogenase (NADP+) / methenyltetrahydrofolate cyclohydrolase